MPCGSVLNHEAVDEKFFLSERALAGIKAKRERMKGKGHGFGAQFIDPSKPCYTIPARYWKDGYDALVGGPDRARRLTLEELKAIQTFPPSFQFCGTFKEQVIQIGNAVPYKLSEAMADYVMSLMTRS
jgi:site-specific DNA-cytosine methylase